MPTLHIRIKADNLLRLWRDLVCLRVHSVLVRLHLDHLVHRLDGQTGDLLAVRANSCHELLSLGGVAGFWILAVGRMAVDLLTMNHCGKSTVRLHSHFLDKWAR